MAGDYASLKKDIRHRMEQAVEVMRKEFAGLRTGRAHISLLDPVQVEAYGQSMPLNQVGTVGSPEPRMLTVSVWDKGMVKAAEKAIRDAGLGLNPMADGQTIRIPVPPLTEERRQELTKVAAKYAETTRIAVRNVRRDGNDNLKKMEKDGLISQDELHTYTAEIQKMTDDTIKSLDEVLDHKQKEIMQV
ncbi:ribosome recycling factor [Haematospirillum sp. 15-248]|nr:ribosome recycling factor [Haematospirillum sp. H4890]NKD74213.1 ribosome recycling factor [Haematospirillum sp. H4485]NKD87118.1 ribosome recycling factor [Haematospirillum sp. 15-248]